MRRSDANPSTSISDYAVWRRRYVDEHLVHDDVDGSPAERLLQVVWLHQRLKPGPLRLTDGRAVRVLHPGFRNFEAGPDFQRAMLQFDNEAPVRGDVEIDVAVAGWRAHGHDTNPAFAGTILRVVWKAPAGTGASVLPLHPNLDSPWSRLQVWAAAEPPGDLPARLRGVCCAPLSELDDVGVSSILQQAARVRLETKSSMLMNRAKHVGWENALWEGLFAGLGYKQNPWPMRALAMAIPDLAERNGDRSAVRWLASLLGISGLLPDEMPRGSTRKSAHLRDLWDVWWRLRDELAPRILPKAVWQLSGVRPANRPERRLALAAQWLANGRFMRGLENWFAAAKPNRTYISSLTTLLGGQGDEFWESHCTFSARAMPRSAPLLGEGRATDLTINTILPWFHARALSGRNGAAREKAEALYAVCPKAADNSVLKLARQRLLGTRSMKLFATASAQQGLLQIVRDFCAHTDALCTDCPFPDYARQFSSVAGRSSS